MVQDSSTACSTFASDRLSTWAVDCFISRYMLSINHAVHVSLTPLAHYVKNAMPRGHTTSTNVNISCF